jgi:hypothetical protein
MLIGSVVENKLCDDSDAPSMGFSQESLKVLECTVAGVDIDVI